MARVRHRECDVFTEPLQRGRHPTHALQSKRRQHIVFQIDTPPRLRGGLHFRLPGVAFAGGV
jgi:hypothetical protein